MAKFMTAAKQFVGGEEGATMVEYALMVALIAAVCIGVVTTLGTNVSSLFGSAGASVASAS
jgi:pilus assembly protein Flp/PilA